MTFCLLFYCIDTAETGQVEDDDDYSWVLNDSDSDLFGTASGLGASQFILSSKIRTQAFLKAKNTGEFSKYEAPHYPTQ